jgi:NADPH:quinone reductase-like Zn-dependent oxidoreductase
VGHAPASLDFLQLASLPLATLTASYAMRYLLSENKSSIFLIVGASGSVGSMATQLGTMREGITLFATAGRPASHEWCERLGAERVLDHCRPLRPQLQALGIDGVDALLCTSPQAELESLAPLLSDSGRLLKVTPTPFSGNPVPLPAQVLEKLEQHDPLDSPGETLSTAGQWLETRGMKSIVSLNAGTLSPASLRDAYDILDSGLHLGKICFKI